MAAVCGKDSFLAYKPSSPAVACGVDVVFVSPDELDTKTKERLCDVLDESERIRLRHLKDVSAQRQYLVAHVLLRAGLSARYPVELSEWRFSKTRFGQPYIIHPKTLANLSFSLSHTDSFVACAFAPHVRIGIDVEKTDAAVEIHDLATQVLSDYEYTCLKSEPASDQMRRFYQLWTLKESLLKAIGCGLSVAPSRLCIQLQDTAAPKLLDLPQELGSCDDWSFRLIQPTNVHICALAANASPEDTIHVKYSNMPVEMLYRIVCGECSSIPKNDSILKGWRGQGEHHE